MSAKKWTPAQQSAIDARGGTVLVSAAAGSGKTAVLVERVIKLILDDGGCDISELLVVTFTRAAAAEMRARVGAAIDKRLKSDPENKRLLRQKMLLPSAKICTIDSFCKDFVKENFHAAGVSPTFRLLGGSESTALKNKIAAETLEFMYSKGDEAFNRLVRLVSGKNSDREMQELVLRIYDYTRAYYFPEEWLRQAADLYRRFDSEEGLHPWLETVLSDIKGQALYSKMLLQTSLSDMEGDELYDKYSKSHLEMLTYLDKLIEKCEAGEWDDVYNAINGFKPPTIGRAPSGYSGTLKAKAAARYDIVKAALKSAAKLICATFEETRQDCRELLPLVTALTQTVGEFSQRLFAAKKEVQRYDFSDIEHLAINLLIEEHDGRVRRTRLAEEYSLNFKEILLDEYQDTNKAQDMLFKAISRDETNLFMVGDVKQSIYRFRQAMPEIFIGRKESSHAYDGESFPAVINLDRNFRSRSGVTSAVNFFFSRLMSRQAGGIDYSGGEALICGAEYPQTDRADAELHILTGESEDESRSEAAYIAQYIKNAVASGEKCTEGGVLRDARWGDFCILLRSTKKLGAVYAEELKKLGVPVVAELQGSFFETREVTDIMSLLRVIDNPLRDIPLAAVLMSPLYGFVPDEMAEIRLAGGNMPFYSALVRAAENGMQKAADFLEDMRKFRRYAAASPADELIRYIYGATGYYSAAGAMQGGAKRRENLSALLDCAVEFQSSGYRGLSDFIKFTESFGADSSVGGSPALNADAVKIMTIHKSKGLEFPFCIIAGCSKAFGGGRAENIVTDSHLGVGMKCRDDENLRLYDTVPRQAVCIAGRRADLEEEMRVLYVAMTRAKERLVLVLSEKSPEKKLYSLAASPCKALSPYSVMSAGSFADWILAAAVSHPDCGELREMAEITALPSEADFSMKLVVTEAPQISEECEESPEDAPEYDLDEEETFRAAVSYKYPFAELASVPVKLSASHLSEGKIDYGFFAASRPAFMNERGLTPAQKGTAAHKFMQFADYKKGAENPESEIERLVNCGYLTEQEARCIETDKLKGFFESEIYARISASEQCLREYKFTVRVTAGEFDSSLSGEAAQEEIVIQGIADCVFRDKNGLAVLDYKTDRVKSAEELVGRYRDQLTVYKTAVEKCFGEPVTRLLIYSLHTGETAEIV